MKGAHSAPIAKSMEIRPLKRLFNYFPANFLAEFPALAAFTPQMTRQTKGSHSAGQMSERFCCPVGVLLAQIILASGTIRRTAVG